MSEASEVIAQQFIDGGVVPADLTEGAAASKTYVDQQLAIRDANISAAAGAANAAQADIDAHEASTTAHPAQNITYTGLVAGAANVKQGLDNLYTRVNDIIADGDSSAEVVDARGGYPVLGDRLNATDAQLAEIRNDLLDRSINVMSPPPPLVAATGDGISGDGERIQAIINRAATDGRNVFFPPREFLIDEPLVVPNTSRGLRLWGCGLKSKLLLGFDGHLITFPEIPSGLSLCQHVISDLCFVGNGMDSGDLIHAEYVSCLYIERNMFLGLSATGNGIYVGGNPNANESSHDIFIRDNYFDSYNQPGHAAIYLDDLAADMQLSRNIMELRYTVDYGLYIRNCGSLQSFDNHFYNCNKNVLKINGASGKHYMFDNDFIDNSNEDVINIDGTDIHVANGSISFKGCLFMRPGNGYSYICLVKNVYNVSIVDCAFTNPPSGSRSAIRAIDSVTVNDILIDRNIFTNPSVYANGVIENIFGFRCIIQNNLGYKKTVNGMSWFSLNSWVEFPGQSSGMLYLGLYTTDSNDGAIIVHYREGTSGIDFNIFSGKVAGATDGNSPLLIAVPVSPNANIRIDAASNVAIQSKVFVPFNV